VLHSRPHGTIDLREGLVHSCNAYFAQLAVDLGATRLTALADRVKIPLASGGSLALTRDALPQIGYGQAQVVASPLRMASLAGAVAANGVLRAPYVEEGSTKTPGLESLLDQPGARRLASYMRDAVVLGSASSVRSHHVPIAGKTGTAEVSGRESHGWFVGFAPYGPAKKRIAFAVVIEHAGYGSLTAAPAAGEIVSAAVAAGLIGK
jgi:peptidoglycan glycosyltransferase